MMNKNKYLKYILSTLILFSCIIHAQNFANANSKLTKDQRNMITQAKALESSGLIEEATIAYANILLKYPSLSEAFKPLKNIYIRNRLWNELIEISNKYLIAHNNNNKSKLDVFDVYLITNDDKWKDIINEFYAKKTIDLSYMKKILSILLANDKKDIAIEWVNKIRSKTEKYMPFHNQHFVTFPTHLLM